MKGFKSVTVVMILMFLFGLVPLTECNAEENKLTEPVIKELRYSDGNDDHCTLSYYNDFVLVYIYEYGNLDMMLAIGRAIAEIKSEYEITSVETISTYDNTVYLVVMTTPKQVNSTACSFF